MQEKKNSWDDKSVMTNSEIFSFFVSIATFTIVSFLIN